MSTIAELLKVTIDADFNHGTVAETVYVFMKTDPDTTDLMILDAPLDNKTNIIIYEGTGVPVGYTEGSDIIIYEGILEAFTNTYATMILVVAELKQIVDLQDEGGDLSFVIPPIIRLEDRFQVTIRYKWEKLIARG